MTTRPFSIQVFYDARDDKGRSFRATAVFQTDAKDLQDAYLQAEEGFKGRTDVKLGAVLEGRFLRFP